MFKMSATPQIDSEEKQKPGVGEYNIIREFDPEGTSIHDPGQTSIMIKEWKDMQIKSHHKKIDNLWKLTNQTCQQYLIKNQVCPAPG
jgi:hypothetical protein